MPRKGRNALSDEAPRKGDAPLFAYPYLLDNHVKHYGISRNDARMLTAALKRHLTAEELAGISSHERAAEALEGKVSAKRQRILTRDELKELKYAVMLAKKFSELVKKK
ncbi:MAG TPA: hypothetical protein VJI71_02835 [Candidatus Norongarragalinales archaeon]|nr:hypothetical protein [Candidatus Norongarragalinales archaeon]